MLLQKDGDFTKNELVVNRQYYWAVTPKACWSVDADRLTAQYFIV